jgi:hypothetical protein
MVSIVRNTVRRTARSTLRGAAAAAGIAGGGIALNAVALMAIAGGASTAGRGLLAGSGILLAGGVVAFGFVLAYLFLARIYGIRVALRTWYDAHREQALAALEAASRRADVATPTRVRNISRNVGARTSGALRAMPRPARLIARWALKRIGAGSLGALLEAGDASGDGSPARLDAFVRGELLAVSPRPLAVLVAVNLAAAVAAYLWVS